MPPKNRKNLNQIKGAARLKAQRELDAAARRRPGYAKLRADAQASLTKAKRALAALERASSQIDVDLPSFEMPEAEPDDVGPAPLVSSDMKLLRKPKQYSEEE